MQRTLRLMVLGGKTSTEAVLRLQIGRSMASSRVCALCDMYESLIPRVVNRCNVDPNSSLVMDLQLKLLLCCLPAKVSCDWRAIGDDDIESNSKTPKARVRLFRLVWPAVVSLYFSCPRNAVDTARNPSHTCCFRLGMELWKVGVRKGVSRCQCHVGLVMLVILLRRF